VNKTHLALPIDSSKFAVSIFHAYGHEAKCQVLYNPRNKIDFGLHDGEWLERLWSYLGRFAKITCIMTPSHRLTLLTLGLKHFTTSRKHKLGIIIFFCNQYITHYLIIATNNTSMNNYF